MKTKYIKVLTADRLPEKTGIYITNLGSLLFYEYEDEEVFKSLRSEKIFSISQIEFWLEEVLDREEEMRETINIYKECFEKFIPTEYWDEATEYLSTAGNGLAKDLLRREK